MNLSILMGNGFSMLVAAADLARRGLPVILLTDGKMLGGHFAGMQLDGYNFDIGMVLLEESVHADLGADLSSYNPTVRNDWTRFGIRASEWMRSKVDIITTKSPECLVEGRLIPDYLIANRLDELKGAAKPRSLNRNDPRHASHKCSPGVFDSLTYAEAAAVNHGPSFHDQFVEPFVRKVFGVSSTDFLARFHRAAWVPLYYPETLRLAISGQSECLPEYRFWTSSTGCAAQLVENLKTSIESSPNVTIVTEAIASVSKQQSNWIVSTIDGKVYSSHKLAIGLPPDRAGSLFNVPVEKPLITASVILLFATVDASFIRKIHGITMIVDESYAAYRLIDHDAMAGLESPQHRIVLEASPMEVDRLHADKTVEEALREELACLLGMDSSNARDQSAICVRRCVTARDALSIPTFEQVAQANLAANSLSETCSGALLSGNLLGYGLASMNDQLVQGLSIAEQFK